MKIPCTTPFEDLILGSQFVPILTKLGAIKPNEEPVSSKGNIGVFQCKQCKGTFLQEGEALLHYKSHVLASHEEYFIVSLGGSCAKRDCSFLENKASLVHFHCSYCSYSGCEILDLPLHMEDSHLSFYKKVSLILSNEDAQLNKVYTCGECNVSLKGKVSIVQHLLSHSSDGSQDSSSMEGSKSKPLNFAAIINGFDYPRESPVSFTPVVNGSQTPSNAASEEACKEEELETDVEQMVTDQNYQQLLTNELNPLDLISSLIEEDLKSENPLIRTQHFLLEPAENPKYCVTEEYTSDNEENNDIDRKEAVETATINGFDYNAYLNNSPAPGVFQCNLCNEAFKYQYLLAAHKKQIHRGNGQNSYRCCICGNIFSVLADLKRHTTIKHPFNFSHFCQLCGHAFTNSESLTEHLLDHGLNTSKKSSSPLPIAPTPITDSGVQILGEKSVCDGCSEEFSSKAELNRHIVKFQGTCNPDKASVALRCATCGDEFSTLDALKEHRRNAHGSTSSVPLEGGTVSTFKRGFECDYCGKTFGCRSNLRDHLVVHTGDKPYPCDICGKSFSFIHNMKTHRLTHNVERNELCPYCSKAYKSKISLYYHMKKGNCQGLSTKEVPEGFLRCPECLQIFNEERFEAHKAKGTCQTLYRCMHCGFRCKTEARLDSHLQKCLCSQSESSEKKRRMNAVASKSNEPIWCNRCNNYDRDCLCSFTCDVCNKKIFSVGAYSSHQREHKGMEIEEEEKSSYHPPQIRRRSREPMEMLRKRKKRRRRGFRGCGRPKLTKNIEEGEMAGNTIKEEEESLESVSTDSQLNGREISGNSDVAGFDSRSSFYENSSFNSVVKIDSNSVDREDDLEGGNDGSRSLSDSQDNMEESLDEKNNDWMCEKDANYLNGGEKGDILFNETTGGKVIKGETNSKMGVPNDLQN